MGRNTKKPRSKAPSEFAEESEDHPLDEGFTEAGEEGPRRTGRRAGVKIVHQDEDLMVLDKPAGLRMEHGDEDSPSVLEQLISQGRLKEDAAAEAVWPLDVDASGLLLLAREKATLDLLRQQVSDGRLELRYLALVRGRPGQETGTIDQPLFDPGADGSLVRFEAGRGAAAVTEWRLRELYVGFALLECIPRTTVRSQIRAHLQAAGMPLVVDPRYGGGTGLLLSSFKSDYRASRRHEERPLITRLSLHALSLRFARPRTGTAMTFEAAMPKDIRAAIHQLDRFGRTGT